MLENHPKSEGDFLGQDEVSDQPGALLRIQCVPKLDNGLDRGKGDEIFNPHFSPPVYYGDRA